MADKISIGSDDTNEYNFNTDSEVEYSEEEDLLLNNIRNLQKKNGVRQEQFMAFSESDSDAHDNNDVGVSDSDIEDIEKDGDEIIGTKYWGKKSNNYYHSDVLDDDYGSYYHKNNEKAELEEEEAKALQIRLLKELKESDFQLDFQNIKQTEDNKCEKDLQGLKSNFSGLTKKERLQLFEKDSPEFAGFVGDFEGYIEEIANLHDPVLRYFKKQQASMLPVFQFAKLYRSICLTYCHNLLFYLMLKSRRISIKHHPVIKRLCELKMLLNKLKDRNDNIVKPQLEQLLQQINNNVDIKVVNNASGNNPTTKRTSKTPNENAVHTWDPNDSDMQEEDGLESDTDDRRKITYEMAKNKGLMPTRRKQQRNPRVKHRSKYRKALIRRKGTVRPVRKEITKYCGEISGIKTTVSKSVKFKS